MKFKYILIAAMLSVSGNTLAGNVFCGDKVNRIQIENGNYLLFLTTASGAINPLSVGAVGDPLADKYFAMALTAQSTGVDYIIRYTDPSSGSCSNLRFETSKITYVTIRK